MPDNTERKYHILAWETDSRLDPTGKERRFVSGSCRKVARQLAGELGGTAHGSMVYLPDGTKWGCRAFGKA